MFAYQQDQRRHGKQDQKRHGKHWIKRFYTNNSDSVTAAEQVNADLSRNSVLGMAMLDLWWTRKHSKHIFSDYCSFVSHNPTTAQTCVRQAGPARHHGQTSCKASL